MADETRGAPSREAQPKGVESGRSPERHVWAKFFRMQRRWWQDTRNSMKKPPIPSYSPQGVMPLRRGFVWTMVVIMAAGLVASWVLLAQHFGWRLWWVWFVRLAIACVECAVYHGGFTAGTYLRQSWADKARESQWRDLANQERMRAALFFSVGLALLTLAQLFKPS